AGHAGSGPGKAGVLTGSWILCDRVRDRHVPVHRHPDLLVQDEAPRRLYDVRAGDGPVLSADERLFRRPRDHLYGP
ncbi:MAG: hypothetical protein MPJ22_00220, partial [Pirellulales bacterium]|nr:hypothetical protein [Pirellulales bacterium]